MILAIDVGNTNIVLSVLKDDTIVFSARIASDVKMTTDQYTIEIMSILDFYKIDLSLIEGVIISSVVPEITEHIRFATQKITNKKVLVIGPGVKTGLNIKIDFPSELGADFVCSSVYAKSKYSLPLIIVDMGTATKISILDKEGSFIGGCIMAGMRISANALSQNTAQLPYISFDKPESIIGKNTVECMKSGVIYGTAAMIDGMINKYKQKLNCENLNVILTGGDAKNIIDFCENSFIYDEDVIIKGLKLIYDKNNIWFLQSCSQYNTLHNQNNIVK